MSTELKDELEALGINVEELEGEATTAPAESPAPSHEPEVARTRRKRKTEEAPAEAEGEAPKAPPAPQMPIRSVMVVFDFVRRDGTRGQSRVFLQGAIDIRTQLELQTVEAEILKAAKEEFLSVMVTNWKQLEA